MPCHLRSRDIISYRVFMTPSKFPWLPDRLYRPSFPWALLPTTSRVSAWPGWVLNSINNSPCNNYKGRSSFREPFRDQFAE